MAFREHETDVGQVKFYEFREYSDIRGDLVVADFKREIPFEPKRFFLVHGVKNPHVRGEHVHKQCEQFLVCVNGSINIVVDDGYNRREFALNKKTMGLYIPPLVWATQYNHSPGSVLLVFASQDYDADDYIRDYEQFLEYIKK